jgi:hypothetical protein
MILVQVNPITKDTIAIGYMIAETMMPGVEFVSVSPMVATPFGCFAMLIDSHDCPKGRI